MWLQEDTARSDLGQAVSGVVTQSLADEDYSRGTGVARWAPTSKGNGLLHETRAFRETCWLPTKEQSCAHNQQEVTSGTVAGYLLT